VDARPRLTRQRMAPPWLTAGIFSRPMPYPHAPADGPRCSSLEAFSDSMN
jgi:hypothetical protein